MVKQILKINKDLFYDEDGEQIIFGQNSIVNHIEETEQLENYFLNNVK